MPLKILIAEDNESVADLYKTLLEKRGHQVVVTYNGEQCLKRYLSELNSGNLKGAHPFDVVLVDFAMPKMDGATLVGKIFDHRPNQRIVFGTAYEKEMVKKFDEIRRPVEVLNKPFTHESLIKSIETKVSAMNKPVFQKGMFRKTDEDLAVHTAGPGPSRS